MDSIQYVYFYFYYQGTMEERLNLYQVLDYEVQWKKGLTSSRLFNYIKLRVLCLWKLLVFFFLFLLVIGVYSEVKWKSFKSCKMPKLVSLYTKNYLLMDFLFWRSICLRIYFILSQIDMSFELCYQYENFIDE